MMRYIILVLAFGTMMSACDEETNQRFQSKPSAFGPLNQLVVVADQAVWEEVRDTFRFFYGAPYPLMPQPEPSFDIVHYRPEDLRANQSRRHLRTYILLGVAVDTFSQTMKLIKRDLNTFDPSLDGKSYAVKKARDKWAKNQFLAYLYADDLDGLVDAVGTTYGAIAREIRDFEKKALDAQVYRDGRKRDLEEEVQDSFGIQLKLPQSAQKAIFNEEIAWIRMETKEASSSILLSKLKYEDTTQLTKSGMLDLRDRLTSKHIQGGRPGSYMVTNPIDLPVLYDRVELNGLQAYEIRGIWEMENAFLGGPYVTYLVIGPNLESLYFIDLFVYAPGEDKREYVQKLEHIAGTVQIISG